MGYIKTQWRKEIDFLRFHKKIFKITIMIFIISMIVDVLGCYVKPEIVINSKGFLMEIFGDISVDDSSSDIFWFILTNNLKAVTQIIFVGVIPFVFLPVLFLVGNSIIIVIVSFLGLTKTNIIAILAHILPHGIIEIPIIWLSCSLGLYLCLSITKKIVKKRPVMQCFGNVFRTYIMVILPGVLIAAFIEAYITPLIGALFI